MLDILFLKDLQWNQDIEQLIHKNVYQYFSTYLTKYLACFSNSNINGELNLGINDIFIHSEQTRTNNQSDKYRDFRMILKDIPENPDLLDVFTKDKDNNYTQTRFLASKS